MALCNLFCVVENINLPATLENSLGGHLKLDLLKSLPSAIPLFVTRKKIFFNFYFDFLIFMVQFCRLGFPRKLPLPEKFFNIHTRKHHDCVTTKLGTAPSVERPRL